MGKQIPSGPPVEQLSASGGHHGDFGEFTDNLSKNLSNTIFSALPPRARIPVTTMVYSSSLNR